jgi:hypothetical protein
MFPADRTALTPPAQPRARGRGKAALSAPPRANQGCASVLRLPNLYLQVRLNYLNVHHSKNTTKKSALVAGFFVPLEPVCGEGLQTHLRISGSGRFERKCFMAVDVVKALDLEAFIYGIPSAKQGAVGASARRRLELSQALTASPKLPGYSHFLSRSVIALRSRRSQFSWTGGVSKCSARLAASKARPEITCSSVQSPAQSTSPFRIQ